MLLKAASCISMTFFDGREGKASLSFKIFAVPFFVAWANVLVPWLCLDFASVAALGLGGIGSGIFDTLL